MSREDIFKQIIYWKVHHNTTLVEWVIGYPNNWQKYILFRKLLTYASGYLALPLHHCYSL